MKEIAILGDESTGTGPITSVSSKVYSGGSQVALVGDSGICYGHKNPVLFTITSGSSKVFDNGIPVAIDGSSLSCGHSITTKGRVKFQTSQ